MGIERCNVGLYPLRLFSAEESKGSYEQDGNERKIAGKKSTATDDDNREDLEPNQR